MRCSVIDPVPARRSILRTILRTWAFPVLIVLWLATLAWVSFAGTEVLSRVERLDDAVLAGTWTGPGQAMLVLKSNGEFRASHLPKSTDPSEDTARLDSGDARWTRERHDWNPDTIRVHFAGSSETELLLDVRRSWRGRPELILWTFRYPGRNLPVTFVRRS